jgi:hypothetical protein
MKAAAASFHCPPERCSRILTCYNLIKLILPFSQNIKTAVFLLPVLRCRSPSHNTQRLHCTGVRLPAAATRCGPNNHSVYTRTVSVTLLQCYTLQLLLPEPEWSSSVCILERSPVALGSRLVAKAIVPRPGTSPMSGQSQAHMPFSRHL